MNLTTPKTPALTETGYAPGHFGDAYWLDAPATDQPRIARAPRLMFALVDALIAARLITPASRMIDVGAGAGQFVAAFRKAGYTCDGCEFSPSGRRLALERFGITLMDGDLRSHLDVPGAAYDFATCVGVLTMIPAAFLPNAMSELARILRPGGILHVLLINYTATTNVHHLTALPFDTWSTLLHDAGFLDITNVCDPRSSGLGVCNEFGGIFRK